MTQNNDANDYFWGTQGMYTGGVYNRLGLFEYEKDQKRRAEWARKRKELAEQQEQRKQEARRQREEEKLRVKRNREQERLQTKWNRQQEKQQAKHSSAQARSKQTATAKRSISEPESPKATVLQILSLLYGFIASFPLTVMVVKIEWVAVWWEILIAWFVGFLLAYGFFVTFKWVTYTITACIVLFLAAGILIGINGEGMDKADAAASMTEPIIASAGIK